MRGIVRAALGAALGVIIAEAVLYVTQPEIELIILPESDFHMPGWSHADYEQMPQVWP